ncbi:DUF4178 domain-containing protein [Rhizobacter sp. Root1221]|uniref:DUF4178 domain-containing protein n=1 Tax=Rhizobacter sp. Root1221 TaxID=1736433 RepID=UPI000A7FA5E7|nr:DUF4178 domain-containing protein [Rhizobacter sp. Root1221]
MTIESSPQRAYRAACPNCGAPVDFRSSASAFAVCTFCRSTLVRDGDALRKIGQSADLFDDHSPLQLGVTGVAQSEGFALVGRLQYRYGQGTWNEWHALFDNGRSGWLSEDNGAYVLGFDQPVNEVLPTGDKLIVGNALTVGGRRWHVASVTVAKLIAAQGELPHPPNLDRGFVVADLRAAGDEVGTLDYSQKDKPLWSVGRSVQLADLRLVGLNDGSGGGGGGAEKTLKARGIECPSCGAALEVKLSTTQSIVCHQCHAVVDVSQGVGGDLAHYAQENGSEPLIPLGTSGTLKLGAKQALSWQVVGYAERCEVPDEAEDEEQSFWREYLLYHRTAGFAFLIDAEDGWSWSAPVTGVPEGQGDKVKYQGQVYRRMYRYKGAVTYVLGEFYWQLQRNQLTDNADYLSGTRRLNREETREGDTHEVVWSAGEALSAETVRKAFRLAPDKAAALERDVTPTSSGGSWLAKLFLWGFILVVVLMMFRCGSRDNCRRELDVYGQSSLEYQTCLNNSRSSSRTGGGSWGGFSSGGGHK